LADARDRSALSQVCEVVEFILEWVEQYVDKEINDSGLSENFLSLLISDTLASKGIRALSLCSEEYH
jgi:hypothetical protein